MKYTKLGKSDLTVSRSCMGCRGFGNAATGHHLFTTSTIALALCMGFMLAACAGGTVREAEEEPATPDAQAEQDYIDEEEDVMNMKIGDTPVSVAWEENESVDALKALCAEGPLTIKLHMYGGFEQVGDIGSSLPRNDVQTTTQAGDIVLYSGDQMVVFYGSNSWAYTRLGHITDQDPDGMRSLLENGDVTVTLTAENHS